MEEVVTMGINTSTLWTATGSASILLYLIWYLMREIKRKEGQADEAKDEKDEALKMLHDNQLQMLDVFNNTVSAIMASVEAQKRNTELIKEIKHELSNGEYIRHHDK